MQRALIAETRRKRFSTPYSRKNVFGLRFSIFSHSAAKTTQIYTEQNMCTMVKAKEVFLILIYFKFHLCRFYLFLFYFCFYFYVSFNVSFSILQSSINKTLGFMKYQTSILQTSSERICCFSY